MRNFLALLPIFLLGCMVYDGMVIHQRVTTYDLQEPGNYDYNITITHWEGPDNFSTAFNWTKIEPVVVNIQNGLVE
jgi:hypothetical protein